MCAVVAVNILTMEEIDKMFDITEELSSEIKKLDKVNEEVSQKYNMRITDTGFDFAEDTTEETKKRSR